MKKLLAGCFVALAAGVIAVFPACGQSAGGNEKISEEEWRAAIQASAAADNFTTNYTINYGGEQDGGFDEGTAEIMYTPELIYSRASNLDGAVTETAYYVIDKESDNCIVMFSKSVHADGTDYGWRMQEGENISYLGLHFIATYERVTYYVGGREIGHLSDLCDYMTYDELTGTYSGTFDVGELGVQISLSVAITDGYISGLNVGVHLEGGVSVMEMTLTDYGKTTVTLPQELEELLKSAA